MPAKTRIMYVEPKGDVIGGMARIGRVTYSKSGKSLYYRGREFFAAEGFKSNYMDAETHEQYWISGCKRKGGDRLYSGIVEIDDDVREEYWTEIRKMPEKKATKKFHSVGKYSK
jgi:hypothetical protein